MNMHLLTISFLLVGGIVRAQEPLRFDSTGQNPAVRFVFPNPATDPYLQTLRREYALDSLVRGADTDVAKALRVVRWTHTAWRHNGSNEPSKPDALTILKEAKEGRNFRCVEYAKVSTDALLALGLKARVLALKTKDAETRRSGAGHVLTEIWLPSARKWAVADAQFDVMPFLGNVPLNAVELQRALAGGQSVTFRNADGPVSEGRANRYVRFVNNYLYFFDVALDQRQVPYAETFKIGDDSQLMLVPLGVAPPTTFQQRFPLDYVLATHALRDFYQSPL